MNFDFKNPKPSQNQEINIDIITSPKNNVHSERQILNADQPIKEEKINQITGIFQQLFGKRDNLAEKTNLDQIDDLYFKKQQKKQEQENPIIYKINNKKESFFRLFLGLLQLTCILLDFKMHTVLNALQVKKIAESNNQANLDIQVYVLWVYTMMTLLASHLTWYRLPLKRKYFLPDRKRVQMQQKQKNKKFNFLELFTGKKTSSKNNKSAQHSIIPEETKCQKFSVFLSSLNGYFFAFFSMIGLPPIYYYFYSFFTNRGDQDIDQFLYSQTGSRKVWAHLQSVMSTFLSCHYIFTNRDNGYIGWFLADYILNALNIFFAFIEHRHQQPYFEDLEHTTCINCLCNLENTCLKKASINNQNKDQLKTLKCSYYKCGKKIKFGEEFYHCGCKGIENHNLSIFKRLKKPLNYLTIPNPNFFKKFLLVKQQHLKIICKSCVEQEVNHREIPFKLFFWQKYKHYFFILPEIFGRPLFVATLALVWKEHSRIFDACPIRFYYDFVFFDGLIMLSLLLFTYVIYILTNLYNGVRPVSILIFYIYYYSQFLRNPIQNWKIISYYDQILLSSEVLQNSYTQYRTQAKNYINSNKQMENLNNNKMLLLEELRKNNKKFNNDLTVLEKVVESLNQQSQGLKKTYVDNFLKKFRLIIFYMGFLPAFWRLGEYIVILIFYYSQWIQYASDYIGECQFPENLDTNMYEPYKSYIFISNILTFLSIVFSLYFLINYYTVKLLLDHSNKQDQKANKKISKFSNIVARQISQNKTMKKLIEQIFQKSQPEIIQEELVLLAEQNPFMIEILQELKNSSERIVSQQIHKQMEFFNSIKMDESQPLVGMRQQIGGKIKDKIINHEQVQKNLQNFNDNLIKNKDINQFLQTVKKDNHNLRGNFNKALNYFNQKKDKILNYDLEEITDVKLGQSTYYFHQIIKILDSTLNEIDKKQIDNGIISNCEERVTSKLSEHGNLSVNREILQPNKNYEQMTSTSKFSIIDLKNRKNSRYNSSTVNSNNILTSTYSNSNKQLLVPNEKMGQLIDIPVQISRDIVQYKSSNDNLLYYNQNLDSFQSNLPNKKQNGQSNNEKSQFSPKITNSMSYQFNYNDHKNSNSNQQNQKFSNKNLDDNIQTSNLSFQSPLQKKKKNNSSNINVNISINNNQTNIQKQENNYNLFYKNQKKSSNNNKNNKNNIGSSRIISGQNLDNLEEEDIEIEQDSSVEIPPKN